MSDNKMLPAVGKRPLPPSAGRGRKKGELNRVTRAVKEALEEAFERMGGVDSLVEWGRSDPTEFYKLWAKLLPAQINANVTGDIKNTAPIINLTLSRD